MPNERASYLSKILVFLFLFLLNHSLHAATFLFSAPPRESEEAANAKYAPIAEHLSKVTKHKFIYEYPGNWGVYRTKMVNGKYDLVFDGPHFNSYRAEYLKHNILVKIAGGFTFVGIVRKDESRIKSLDHAAGRTACAHPPPNLGTLTLLSNFGNPLRQPAIVNTKGWANIYQGLVDKKCNFAMLPLRNLKAYDPDMKNVKIIFRANTLPNQAFSAGPRIPSETQLQIIDTLTQTASSGATEGLRLSYKAGKNLQKASNAEYRNVSRILLTEWGFSQ